MYICKNIYFWCIFIIITLFFVLLTWPYVFISKILSLTAGYDFVYLMRTAVWAYPRCIFFLLKPIVRVRVEHPETVQKNSPCIIVLNHQSFLDSYMLGLQDCINLCFIIADWPFKKLFFFAPVMRMCKYIRVGTMDDKLRFIESCRETLKNGGTLVCFPEGTRSRTGQLQNFHAGIFRISVETGIKIVPMVLNNTGQVCRPGSFKINPQPILIKLLEPLSARADLTPRQSCMELKERVHGVIYNTLNP